MNAKLLHNRNKFGCLIRFLGSLLVVITSLLISEKLYTDALVQGAETKYPPAKADEFGMARRSPQLI